MRVIRLAGQPVAPEIVERWRPVPMERLGEDGRVPLYQMGNNLHHERMLESALERPGVLTLHDVVLHHLLIERTLARGEIEPYREWLACDHGWRAPRWPSRRAGAPTARACLFALPCHRRLAQSQRGVLVHSEWARARLLEEMPDLAVRVVPMPMPLPPEAERRRGRGDAAALGHPGDAPVLGSFGFQTPIKRTDVVIAALARPGASRRPSAGGRRGGARARSRRPRARAGVADRVHVTGFLDRDDARRRDGRCRSLRQPALSHRRRDLGVAAAVLAAGRPALVSDYAQFTDLPRDCVAHVPVGEGEVEAIAARGCALLADRDALAALGRRAREHVRREHDPGRAAARDRRGVRRAGSPAARAKRSAALPSPPSTLTWGVMGGELEVEGAAMPWPEGERRRLRLRVRNDGRARWLAGTRGAGGVVFEVRLLCGEGAGGDAAATRDELAGQPWPPLPADLAPGEEATIELEVRRPLGAARLRIEPHVLGVAGATRSGVRDLGGRAVTR